MAPRTRKIARFVQALVVVAVVGVAVFYLTRSVDVPRLEATVLGARKLPLFLGVALVIPAALCRTLYWRALLAPVKAVGFRDLLGYTFTANAANVLFPARAGDAMRTWLLRSRHGIPLASSGAIVVIEKACDLFALALVVLPLPWLLPDLPPIAINALRTVVVIVAIAIVALAIVSRYAHRIRWLAGLEGLRRPAVIARGFGAVLLFWMIDAGLILLILNAVSLPVRIEDALLVLLLVNLAIAIPATPGQLGPHEIASAAALRLQGAPPEQAIAFALLYHGAQVVPVLLLGLIDARVTFAARAPAP